MFHPNDVEVLAPKQIEQQAAKLRPTLLVGIGGTANKVLADIRQRLTERFGDAAQVPCFRFLAIDTDANDLESGASMGFAPASSISVGHRSARPTRASVSPPAATPGPATISGML